MTVRIAVVLLTLLSLSGCVLIPLVEPDEPSSPPSSLDLAPAAHAAAPISLSAPKYEASRPAVSKISRLEKLVSQLAHPEPVVRTHAAFWIGEMGAKARPAVPPLISCLHDPSKWVRRASAKALGKIRAQEAVRPLILTLGDRDRYVAHSAANALRKINTQEARGALAVYRGL